MSLLSENDYRVAIVALEQVQDNPYLGGEFKNEAASLLGWLRLQMRKQWPDAPAAETARTQTFTVDQEDAYQAILDAAASGDVLFEDLHCGWDPNSGPTC